MPTSKIKMTFKTLLLGDAGTGKTQLFNRLIGQDFEATSTQTIGVSFGSKDAGTIEHPIKLQVWDTSSEEKFKTIVEMYYKDTDAIVLLVDSTQDLNEQVFNYAPTIKKYCLKTPIIVVMSKSDEVDQPRFNPVQLQQIVTEQGLIFHSAHTVSAKNNHNIHQVEEEITRLAVEKSKKDNINQRFERNPCPLESTAPSQHQSTLSIFSSQQTKSTHSMSPRLMQLIKHNPHITAILTGAIVGVVLSATGVFTPFGAATFGIAALAATGAAVFGLAMMLANTLSPCISRLKDNCWVKAQSTACI